MRFNKLREPLGVVGFDRQEDDIELRRMFGKFVEVPGGNRYLKVQIGHRNVEALFLHRFHMSGPLIDDRDIQPRIGQVGAH